MRSRRRDPPWWVLSIVLGLPFGVGMAVFFWFQDDHPSGRRMLFAGLVNAVLFGPMMGFVVSRANRTAHAAVGDLTAEQWREVTRAATRGRVPEDVTLRAATARLVRHRLAVSVRHRRWSLVVCGVMAAVGLALAVVAPWSLVLTVVGALLAVASRAERRRLTDRLAMLEQAG